MATRHLKVNENIDTLREIFQKIIEEVGFTSLKNEDNKEGYYILGINQKRRSIWTMTVLSLLSGYIPVKRTAIEISAKRRENYVDVDLKCVPYIDVVDMEAIAENPQEQELCNKIADMIEIKILDKITEKDN
jgi:hypothetical protein